MDKLLTFVGDAGAIRLKIVQTLCSAQKSATLWQLAEAVVWKEIVPKSDEAMDLSLLLPLISQVRTQLQHGLTLSVLLEHGMPRQELAAYFPSLKTAALDKMLPIAKNRRTPFFKRALDLLFEIELTAKNSSLEPSLIFDLLLTKITLLKRHYALSASQPAL